MGNRPSATRSTSAGIRLRVSLSPRVTPVIVRPPIMWLTSTAASVPNGGAPTTAAVPRRASASTQARSTGTAPVVSTTPSTPAPPVSAVTVSARPGPVVLTVWVAPSSFASSSRAATRSITTMFVAGVSLAASTAERPTAPAPVIRMRGAGAGREHVPHRPRTRLYPAAQRGEQVQWRVVGRP